MSKTISTSVVIIGERAALRTAARRANLKRIGHSRLKSDHLARYVRTSWEAGVNHEHVAKQIQHVLETDTDIKARIRGLSAEAPNRSSRQITESMKSEQEAWRRVIERLHIRLE